MNRFNKNKNMANPNTNAAETSDDVRGIAELQQATDRSKSIAQRKAPIEMQFAEEYADTKGLPVKIQGNNGTAVEGRLIAWDNDNSFRVVWKEDGAIVSDVFNASDLYAFEGNSRLKGAVEFCRANQMEIMAGRGEITEMLSTIDETGKKAA